MKQTLRLNTDELRVGDIVEGSVVIYKVTSDRVYYYNRYAVTVKSDIFMYPNIKWTVTREFAQPVKYKGEDYI